MGLLDKLFGGGKKTETSGGVTLQYTSGPGDTCRSLAKRFYGDESQWERIYNPNKRLIQDEVQSGSDQLVVGTGLTIVDAKYDASGQPVAAG
ncbi:MAG: LysM peptidoglycan-binding domain-containing protein [Chloroflexota bacterium]